MGRLLVPRRFAVKDLRGRPGEALLVLLACAMAATDAAAQSGGMNVFPAPRGTANMVLVAVTVTVLTALVSPLGERRSAAEVLPAGAS